MNRASRRFRLPRPPAVDHGEGGFGLIEAMLAIVILAVGLLGIAGLALSVADQSRGAAFQTDQALAGQQVLERTIQEGYDEAQTGETSTTETVGGHDYTVTRTVTQEGGDVRQVEVEVSAVGRVGAAIFTTRIHRERSL